MLSCLAYLAFTGSLAFLLGRLLPKQWLTPDAFPFLSFPFEREGAVYERLGIKQWQSRVPDMSRILPALMPPKKLTGDFRRRLEDMIAETCVAELIHALLCVTGLYCLRLWPGRGGRIVTILYLLSNLPFILIQRYNRPRLRRLLRRRDKQTPTGEQPCQLLS